MILGLRVGTRTGALVLVLTGIPLEGVWGVQSTRQSTCDLQSVLRPEAGRGANEALVDDGWMAAG